MVILLKTIKKGEEWLTNYGRHYWLKASNYNTLDAAGRKKCKEHYKISAADVYDDERTTSEEDEKSQGSEEDSNEGDSDSSSDNDD